MAKAIDLSTAGIQFGYAIETTAGEKPDEFINVPNPKSIPDFNPEPSTYDVTSLNDLEWKRYISGLKDVGGALGITFGMSEVFRKMWQKICSDVDAVKEDNKRMWVEFYHPKLSDGFFFTAEPADMGWSAADTDSAWDATVNITPTGEIGWDTAIAPVDADASSSASA